MKKKIYFTFLVLTSFNFVFAKEFTLNGDTAKEIWESMSLLKAKEYKEEPGSSTWIKNSKNIVCSKSIYGTPKQTIEYQCKFSVSKNGHV